MWSGFSKDKGKAELFTLPSWTQISSLLLLASSSRDRVLAFRAAVNACCSGKRRSRAGGGGCQGLAGPRSRSCCCSRAAEGAVGLVIGPVAAGPRRGRRVPCQFDLLLSIYVNKAEERQTEPEWVRRARLRPPFRTFPCRRRCRPGEGAGAARTVPARGVLAPRRLRATHRRRGEPAGPSAAGSEGRPGRARLPGLRPSLPAARRARSGGGGGGALPQAVPEARSGGGGALPEAVPAARGRLRPAGAGQGGAGGGSAARGLARS